MQSSKTKNPNTQNDLIFLFPYRSENIKRALWNLKYRNILSISHIFAEEMYKQILKINFLPNTTILIIPIPKTPSLFSYGARHASSIALSLSDKDTRFNFSQNILKRKFRKKRQTQISVKSERIKNMENAFHVSNKDAIKDSFIILVDDISTTGATLKSAKKALICAGASHVQSIVVAH